MYAVKRLSQCGRGQTTEVIPKAHINTRRNGATSQLTACTSIRGKGRAPRTLNHIRHPSANPRWPQQQGPRNYAGRQRDAHTSVSPKTKCANLIHPLYTHKPGALTQLHAHVRNKDGGQRRLHQRILSHCHRRRSNAHRLPLSRRSLLRELHRRLHDRSFASNRNAA